MKFRNVKYGGPHSGSSIEQLAEDTLLEKKWVEVESSSPNTNGPGYKFYFYTTDKNAQNDVNTLIPVINHTQTGTYKQQLNKDVLQRLRTDYAACQKAGIPFSLRITNSNVSEDDLKSGVDIITLTDRTLRKNAQASVDGSSVVIDEIPDTIKNNQFLVHHIKKGEHDNDPSNIYLIERLPNELEISHAVHKIIENKGSPLKKETKTIHILDYDLVKKQWKIANTVTITIS